MFGTVWNIKIMVIWDEQGCQNKGTYDWNEQGYVNKIITAT